MTGRTTDIAIAGGGLAGGETRPDGLGVEAGVGIGGGGRGAVVPVATTARASGEERQDEGQPAHRAAIVGPR